MPCCEMCGKENQLVTAEVEGVDMQLCPSCSKFGTIRKQVQFKKTFYKPAPKEKPEYKVVHNYSALLKSAREKRNMSQEDFAKFLNERESVLAKWEQNTLTPDVEVARKMSRALGVELVEKDLDIPEKIEFRKNKDELTLGDFIKIRKRK